MKKSVYTRPNKPDRVNVTRRQQAAALSRLEVPVTVAVHKSTECHITPPDVARRMIDYLGPVCDSMALEPSAGTGSLIMALLNSGRDASKITAVEVHEALCRSIRHRLSEYGQPVNLLNECFISYADRESSGIKYNQIVMNPPFRKTRQHIKSAFSLLEDGGTLVALVPSTYEHPDAELLETLEPDTFSFAKVYSKIIRISR